MLIEVYYYWKSVCSIFLLLQKSDVYEYLIKSLIKSPFLEGQYMRRCSAAECSSNQMPNCASCTADNCNSQVFPVTPAPPATAAPSAPANVIPTPALTPTPGNSTQGSSMYHGSPILVVMLTAVMNILLP